MGTNSWQNSHWIEGQLYWTEFSEREQNLQGHQWHCCTDSWTDFGCDRWRCLHSPRHGFTLHEIKVLTCGYPHSSSHSCCEHPTASQDYTKAPKANEQSKDYPVLQLSLLLRTGSWRRLQNRTSAHWVLLHLIAFMQLSHIQNVVPASMAMHI